MNLYRFHDEAGKLAGHDNKDELVPLLVWNKFKNQPSELKKREKILARDPNIAKLYSFHVLDNRFKLAEPVIAKNRQAAMIYAKVWGEFPEAEEMFSNFPGAAMVYATEAIRKPFPKGEVAIATDNVIATRYLQVFPERKAALEKLGYKT